MCKGLKKVREVYICTEMCRCVECVTMILTTRGDVVQLDAMMYSNPEY